MMLAGKAQGTNLINGEITHFLKGGVSNEWSLHRYWYVLIRRKKRELNVKNGLLAAYFMATSAKYYHNIVFLPAFFKVINPL